MGVSIGLGNFTTIFRAIDKATKNEVAIKQGIKEKLQRINKTKDF